MSLRVKPTVFLVILSSSVYKLASATARGARFVKRANLSLIFILFSAENDGYGNALISLPGSVLADENIDYSFNLTVTNFVNLSDWATFDVQRTSDPIFDVVISTNVDEFAIKRSKR